jgi:hypothetical protein
LPKLAVAGNVTDRHTNSRTVLDESERNGQLIAAEVADGLLFSY